MQRLSIVGIAFLFMFGVLFCEAQSINPPTLEAVTNQSIDAAFNTTGTSNAMLMYAPKHRANISNFEAMPISDGPNSVSVTGLVSNTVYEVKIQATMAGEVVNSNSSFIRTAPDGVTIGYVLPKPTFAVVMFETTPGATAWEVKHTNMRTRVMENCTCAPGSLAYAAVLTSLDANTDYQVQVRVAQVYGSVNFTEMQSPFGPSFTFTTERLSVFGRVVVNVTSEGINRSRILDQINSFYADNTNVHSVMILTFNQNDSMATNVSLSTPFPDATTVFGHYEILVDNITAPNVDGFILPDTPDYYDSQVRFEVTSQQYVFNRDLGLFYVANVDCRPIPDVRTWTIFSNDGLGGTAILPVSDETSLSSTVIEFNHSAIIADNREIFQLEPNTLSGIGMNYLVQDCDASGPFYRRVYEVDNENHPGNDYTIFDTTSDTGILPEVNFVSVAESNGVAVRVSFPSTILERVVEYMFEYTGSGGSEVVTLAEANIDSSDVYTVLLTGLTKNSTTSVNISARFRSFDQITFLRTIGASNVTTDENECVTTPNICDTNAICTNTQTSFTCTCRAGFSGDGTVCEDINECLDDATCTSVQYCENSQGTFECRDIPTPTITFIDVQTTSFQVDVGALVDSLMYNLMVENAAGTNVLPAQTVNGPVDVSGLTAGFLYTVTVQVAGKDVTVTTNQYTLPGGVGGFTIGAVRDVSVEFRWAALPMGSRILINLDPILSKRETPVSKSMNFTGTAGVIAGLTSSTRYSGSARLVNDAGNGAQRTFAVRTSPSAVTGLMTSRNAEQVNVSWAPSSGAESYLVTVQALSITRTTTNTHILLTLDSGTSYIIQVEACNNDTNLTGDVTVRCSDPATVTATPCTACDENAACVESTCQCNSGFTGDGISCMDINTLRNCSGTICAVNASCEAMSGEMSCQCLEGFMGNGTECNICTSDPSECFPNANCTTTAGATTCQCNVGYSGTHGNCFDINECQNMSICHTNATCENTDDSYTCTCDQGYTGDGVNCSRNCSGTVCAVNASCEAINGEMACQCPEGFVGNGTECNICNSNSSDCYPNANCTTTDGKTTCQCNVGYSGTNGNCFDTNECRNETVCHTDATCENTVGSYTCRCNEGYAGDGAICSRNCSGTVCAVNASCEAINGEMSCQCPEGYIDNGTECNVCDSDLRDCYPNANCTTTDGETTCQCNVGYSGINGNCFDTNECRNEMVCHTDATCENTVGSYTCTCNEGYAGDGVTCSRNCSGTVCAVNASCESINGEVSCQCFEGFVGNGTDCNICTSNSSVCYPNANCTMTAEGSTVCQCKDGYSGTHGNCFDTDECRSEDICHTNAMCENTKGSFQCSCRMGFTGDGIDCLPDCGTPCGENSTCSVLNESPSCLCDAGFVRNGSSCVDECGYSCNPSTTCGAGTSQARECVCGEGLCPDRRLCAENSRCLCSSGDYDAIWSACDLSSCGFESGECICTCEVQNTGSCFGPENNTSCTYNCENETVTCGGIRLETYPLSMKPDCVCNNNDLNIVGIVVPVVVVIILLLIFFIAVLLYQRKHLRGWYNVSGRWDQWRRRYWNNRTHLPHFVRTEYQSSPQPQPDDQSTTTMDSPLTNGDLNGNGNGDSYNTVISNLSTDDPAVGADSNGDASRYSTINSNNLWPAPPSDVEPMYAEINSNRGSVQQTGV